MRFVAEIQFNNALIAVDDLLELSDKYDFAVVRERCTQFLMASVDMVDDAGLLFNLRIADKYGLAAIEVIVPARLVIVADCLYIGAGRFAPARCFAPAFTSFCYFSKIVKNCQKNKMEKH